MDIHPDQLFVLDHCAKPVIRNDEREPWARFMRELARRPNLVCKISGLATEADWQRWTPAALEPYWQVVLGGLWAEPAALRFRLAGVVAGDGLSAMGGHRRRVDGAAFGKRTRCDLGRECCSGLFAVTGVASR